MSHTVVENGLQKMGLKPSNRDLFNPLYPTPTAGRGTFDGKTVDDDHEDSLKTYRCKQCGFRNDAKRVQSPGGDSDGFGNIAITVTSGVGDFTVRGGCAFCGSQNSRHE